MRCTYIIYLIYTRKFSIYIVKLSTLLLTNKLDVFDSENNSTINTIICYE